MLRRVTIFLLLLISLSTYSFSQSLKASEIKNIDGNEMFSNPNIIEAGKELSFFSSRYGINTVFTFNNLGVKTGYDLQSNGVPKQIWQDPRRPENIHAVFTTSNQISGWSDRAGIYFFSSDFGESWINFGAVPPGVRSGFATITGLSNGSAVISAHTAGLTGGNVRSQLYFDEAPGSGSFSEKDPGSPWDINNSVIWPRLQPDSSDRIAVVASTSTTVAGEDTSYFDSWDGTAFTGWVPFGHSTAEVYALATTTAGDRIGMAFLGKASVAEGGDVFFTESTDGGATWAFPAFKIWNLDFAVDSIGGLRGITMAYLGDEPYVSWENAKQPDSAHYYPGLESSIMLWSPSLAGGLGTDGNTKELINIENFDEYPNYGIADTYVPVCRPSLGKADNDSALFLAFSAASQYELRGGNPDTATPYFNIWFMYSTDKGQTWSNHEPINDTTIHNKDWRYANISPTNHVDENGKCPVYMIAQVDSIPGSTTSNPPVQGWGLGVTAEAVVIKTAPIQVPVTGVSDNITQGFKYELAQNYPNPFNPTTKINFTLAERGNVSLKVFDVLGREVITLVNGEKEAGKYNINLNGSNLASGLYIYTLKAGSFSISKKMMLLK